MSIVLEELTKRYAGHPVVNGVSLEIADGEFFVLLGSSGSGKSTLLRMIAGLSEVDAGRVLLHGRDVTGLPPAKRGVGFVFQSYALFRGMSVAENVEFALSIRGVSRAERRRRRDELLELVGLAGLGGRMPRQLSGGQQQRVALARALAHNPEVLLLDEPFGALDAKVRLELRRTIREIQRELGITTIFVTHDQEEAFELADRLAVLSFGRMLETGPPDELYLRPETEFVATFLGTANLMVGEHTAAGVQLGPVQFPLTTRAEAADGSRRVQILFRPEDVALRGSAQDLSCPSLGEAVVEQRSFVGSFERLRLRLPPLPGVRAIAPPVPFGNDGVWVEAARSQDQARRFPLHPGDTTWVGVQRVHALVHPGMKFLLVTDGSGSKAVLGLGGELARLAHAQVTVLETGSEMGEAAERRSQEVRERLGSGLAALETRLTREAAAVAVEREAERQPCDLVVLTPPPREGLETAERVLRGGQHHLLIVPEAHPGQVPTRVLICVAVGEPGKEDVSFAGRLARHLGAEATIMTVLHEEEKGAPGEAHAERFLTSSTRTLWRLGVTASTRMRYGNVRDEILAELAEGKHDLLVLGTPLPGRGGELSLGGLIEKLLPLPLLAELPVLIVRSVKTS
ncbi:MAG: sulfate/thiosulfate transport system ATP-binding protein [Acidobacteriota bacterium]|jgi:ABC-type Fe3+/spermidine/putrescine transport system ATPase subunit/nucleotide-binding universal stress UspA family protein|nr:sulfate/thiosulfate transport system ATP-binding protein [Acidobacteriota bacterium]